MDQRTQVLAYSPNVAYAGKVIAWADDYLQLTHKPRFVADLNQISDHADNLLYLIVPQVTQIEREAISKISARLPQLKIILCTEAAHALAAWELDVFHFVPFALTHSGLFRAYRKAQIYDSRHLEGTVVKIKYEGKVIIVDSAKILFVKGSANYTEIMLSSGKKLTLIKQLAQVEKLLVGNPSIKRIGKSYMFNFSNIQSVGKTEIAFRADVSVVLQASELYTSRVREMVKRFF
jgi:LytTr DNA-binding domain